MRRPVLLVTAEQHYQLGRIQPDWPYERKRAVFDELFGDRFVSYLRRRYFWTGIALRVTSATNPVTSETVSNSRGGT